MVHPAPSITVATVCRNPGSALLRTLQSVHGQTGVRMEHLVIDGASTDGTRDLLEKSTHDRMTFVSEPDGGIYDAMNKAVRLARGQWILYLNAGDILVAPTSLASLALYARDDVDHVAGGLFFRWPDGVTAPAPPPGPAHPLLHMPVFHPATLSRRARLLQRPFDVSYRIAGDMDFFLHEMAAGARFIFIPDPVSQFDFGGISSLNPWLANRETRRTILRHARFSPANRLVFECRLLGRYLLGPLFSAMWRQKAQRVKNGGPRTKHG